MHFGLQVDGPITGGGGGAIRGILRLINLFNTTQILFNKISLFHFSVYLKSFSV